MKVVIKKRDNKAVKTQGVTNEMDALMKAITRTPKRHAGFETRQLRDAYTDS